MLRHQQVLHHRHFAEQADVLEGPRQPGAVDQVGAAEHLVVETRLPSCFGRIQSPARNFWPSTWMTSVVPLVGIEQDVAAGGPVEAGQAVEHGGLAGAVGANQRGDGAALHVAG